MRKTIAAKRAWLHGEKGPELKAVPDSETDRSGSGGRGPAVMFQERRGSPVFRIDQHQFDGFGGCTSKVRERKVSGDGKKAMASSRRFGFDFDRREQLRRDLVDFDRIDRAIAKCRKQSDER
jgi:hypothetical protein